MITVPPSTRAASLRRQALQVTLLAIVMADPLAAATLGGTLTDADSGQPLANRSIAVMADTLFPTTVRTTLTDSSGTFQVNGLAGGSYYVVARPAGYLVRVYGDSGVGYTCTNMIVDNLCQVPSGPPIQLQANTSRSLAMTSQRAAQLRGRVLGMAQGGTPAAVAQAYVIAGMPQGSVPPNVNPVTGQFFIDHLVAGPQPMRACAPGWICRDPQGVESDYFGSDQPSQPLQLVAGTQTDVGDLVLRPASSLSILPQFPPGTTRIDRYPSLSIDRDGAGSLQLGYALDAAFQFNTLRPGTFRIRVATADDPAWIATWLGGASCTPDHCDPADAAPVELAAGQSRQVAPPAVPRQSIAGTVRSAVDGQPLAGIEVSAARWTVPPVSGGPQPRSAVLTDATGRYELSGLLPDGYVVRAQNLANSTPWISERWPDVRCSAVDPQCLPVGLHPFQLGQMQLASKVDFSLELGGWMSGRIYDPRLGLGTPLRGTTLRLLPTDPATAAATIALDQASTRWSSAALPAGAYRVIATAELPSQGQSRAQLFDGVACAGADPASCPLAKGTVVEVSAGGSRDFVDFRIDSAEVLLQSGFE